MLKTITIALAFAISAAALSTGPAAAADRDFLKLQAQQDSNRYDHYYRDMLIGN